MTRRPPISTLFPYPTLSRPPRPAALAAAQGPGGGPAAGPRRRLRGARRDPDLAVALAGRRGPLGGAQLQRLRAVPRSEEHTSELQSPCNLVCRLLLEKRKQT